MFQEIDEVLRLLMLMARRSKKPGSQNRGGLMVLLWTDTDSDDRSLNCTVAAAGPWCAGIKMEELHPVFTDIMNRLGLCTGPHPEPDIEDLCAFTDLHGSLSVLLYFLMKDAQLIFSQKWRHYIETFFHSFILANAEIKVYLKLRIDQKIFQREFKAKKYLKVVLSAQQQLYLDVTCSTQHLEYFKRGYCCCGGHPEVGDSLLLSVPPKAMEQGLFGTVSLHPVTLLRPCVLQYPNVATKLTQIEILVYSPSNVPVTSPSAFLQNLPAHLNCQELGIKRNCISLKERTPTGGTVYRVEQLNCQETNEESSLFSIDQCLVLFLFLQHSDPFTSEISDIMASEMLLDHHLEDVVNNNRKAVTSAVETEMKKTLKAQTHKNKEQEKMRSACEVILSSSITIISSSSNTGFRNACLASMKVQHTHQLSSLLSESLRRVIFRKCIPRRSCSDQTGQHPGSYDHPTVEI